MKPCISLFFCLFLVVHLHAQKPKLSLAADLPQFAFKTKYVSAAFGAGASAQVEFPLVTNLSFTSSVGFIFYQAFRQEQMIGANIKPNQYNLIPLLAGLKLHFTPKLFVQANAGYSIADKVFENTKTSVLTNPGETKQMVAAGKKNGVLTINPSIGLRLSKHSEIGLKAFYFNFKDKHTIETTGNTKTQIEYSTNGNNTSLGLNYRYIF